jgi:inorganic pyrophosphatase
VPSKAIGAFKMSDEKRPDDDVLCVPCADPGWNTLEQIDEFPHCCGRDQPLLLGLQGPR